MPTASLPPPLSPPQVRSRQGVAGLGVKGAGGQGATGTPTTPSSLRSRQGWAGLACRRQVAGASTWWRWGGGLWASLGEAWGLGGLRGQTVACFLPSTSRLADRFSVSVCVCICFSALSLLFSPPQEPARLLPSLPHPSLPSLLPWASTATAQCPPSPLGSLPLTLYIPTGFTPTQVGFSARPPTALPSSHSPPATDCGQSGPPFLSRLRGDKPLPPALSPRAGMFLPHLGQGSGGIERRGNLSKVAQPAMTQILLMPGSPLCP